MTKKRRILRQVLVNAAAGAILLVAVATPWFNRHCFWCGGVTLKLVNFGNTVVAAKESVLDKIVNNYINPAGYTIHVECLNEWRENNGSK